MRWRWATPPLHSIAQQAVDASSVAWEGIVTCRATTGADRHGACVWRAAAAFQKGGRAVSQFIRYTCTAGLLPVVEAALIANGYTRDGSPRAQCTATAAVVWQSGTTAVLLAQPPNNAVAEIEVWGAG